ncbi:hypothetical protein M8J75_012357 [Diaphorina citri]|nr:hypothetical protein M8J75_012357 [Diaphorina citri]KAI5718292.1 hypothetical protein M8J77_019138 [Diaphorina citri]
MTVMNLKHLCHEEKLERDLLDPPLSGGEDGGDGDGGVDMELDESLIRAEECDQLLGRVLEVQSTKLGHGTHMNTSARLSRRAEFNVLASRGRSPSRERTDGVTRILWNLDSGYCLMGGRYKTTMVENSGSLSRGNPLTVT